MFELEKHICFFDASTIRFQSKGVAPVIITVPHDPISRISDWQGFLQTREKGVIMGLEEYLWPIIRDIILQTSKVSVVRGTLPRRLIDYNRSYHDVNGPALRDQQLQHFYSNYHGIIEVFIERAMKAYGSNRCLLLDMHGFKKQPFERINYDIILGTDHRKTIRSGMDVDKQLAFFLRRRGYSVYLPIEENVCGEKYTGAFTVTHYAEKYMINAIQIEIAKKFRTKMGLKLGMKLSKDLADFIELFAKLI
jgi:N-formylglutamate amidohydrolase